MPRHVHPQLSHEEKKARILAAMRLLALEGIQRPGPTDICRMIDEPWTRIAGVPAAGAVMKFLKELVAEGKLKKIPQGVRKHLYQLVEEI